MTYRLIRLPDGPLNEKALERAERAFADPNSVGLPHPLRFYPTPQEATEGLSRVKLEAAIRAFLDAMP